MKTYYIKTYGCQMNVSDSDSIEGTLSENGFARAEDIKDAGIIIVNTCSVRQLPEQKAYSFLGRVEPFIRKNRRVKVIVAGCMAERAGKDIKKRFPFVNLVIGAKNIHKFPKIFRDNLEEWGLGSTKGTAQRKHTGPIPEQQPVSSFVTIMRGCENFCSYCIVPLVRGRETSRPSPEIIKEIYGLVSQGVKEVTLLGQNVNSYRDPAGSAKTLRGTWDFPELLAKINRIRGLERIRFMTSHPKDLSPALIGAIAGLPKVCEHLHLPLQSGSDRVLRKMKRGYTSAQYLAMIEKARKKIPGLSVTTDVLVGFPGETEEDFSDTMTAVKAAGFDSLFAFKYSPRPGTKAFSFEDSVTLPQKEERLQRVLELGNGISCEKNAKLINSVHEILIDSHSGACYEGRTRTNKKVTVPSGAALHGRIAAVKITEVKINSLSGRLEQVLR